MKFWPSSRLCQPMKDQVKEPSAILQQKVGGMKLEARFGHYSRYWETPFTPPALRQRFLGVSPRCRVIVAKPSPHRRRAGGAGTGKRGPIVHKPVPTETGSVGALPHRITVEPCQFSSAELVDWLGFSGGRSWVPVPALNSMGLS